MADSQTPANWNTDVVGNYFIAGTFDDTGSKSPAVSIPANVTPATITVNAAGNYTFGGAGAIGSTGALLKRGTGPLTFTNTAAKGYSGHTYQLQRTNSTVLNGWVDIGVAQTGTGGNLTFTDTTGATLTRRFYRVKVTL